jgi:hypothetical protein
MVHERFEFEMPAPPEVVFDAFHYHEWRHRWDSLVNATRVVGGAPCPFVGAITENSGGGLLKALSMRTRFVSFQRGRVAAAAMEGRSFPFSRWAASMRHEPLTGGRSLMIYTYTFECRPRLLRWLVEPVTKLVFDWQTRKRFARMRAFLQAHAPQVLAWQQMERLA